ncbi:alpha/beta-hydrolase [Pleomassaria siparia CBS 279.74]|uniref:Alpha/beta-hydrolase n=1 Tax=Pleomassaria siparia CBS 279.74 TaxID=1314801 RepID=A0A6G1JQG6_9PLEO|nr:alpha/beta-hydrolase [Pleomassaria siparia CBS 279.74]
MGFNWPGMTRAMLRSEQNNAAATNADHIEPADPEKARDDNEKLGEPGSHDVNSSEEELTKVDTAAPQGTQKVQAMTHVWSKRDLILAYIFIWLMEFILAFSSGALGTMTPYVTSQWELHSLTALTGVISQLIAGIWKLPYAKIMNVWGRPQALCIGVLCTTLGLVLMAACKNIETVCAAQVFFYVGYNSVDFSVTVFIADTSKLKNRGFFIGYAASPWLIATWVYGPAVTSIMGPNGVGIPWGFGILSVVSPVVCLPIVFMFFKNEWKAKKAGLIQPRPNRGNFAQTVFYYLKEFDAVGLLILATGLALFLLAFNIYSYQAEQWKSPLIICFLVFGFLLVIIFGVWEAKFAPITFVPWPLLKNRTVIFTYTMAASMYIGWYIWDSYLYSLLIVLFDQTITHATYINNVYTMGSCFICLVYGVALRYNGHLKWYSLFWGVPLMILGVGLMIKFRQPGQGVGYIVMCLVFIAFGGGVLVTSEQTTLMAVSKQEDFPALLACESMIISIGSAIGSTIAGAIWTGVFPARLLANLPADAMENFALIYGDLTVQASYPVGSPTRDAINLSYAQTQRYMLISAVCVYSITLISVALWQDVDIASSFLNALSPIANYSKSIIMSTDMKDFSSNDGYQLAYQDVGNPSLPPLILLHGFTGSSQVFKRNIPGLSQKYHVIAPDLRGHGASAKTPHGFHVSRLAMDLHNLLSHLKLTEKGSVKCIAGSLGCSILWCYAELFTADVFSHMIWVDQAPMQNYAFDGSWGLEQGNRGMNCEDSVKGLFKGLGEDPDTVHRGTIAACLSYRSHPLLSDKISDETFNADEAFFLGEAQKGDPVWYAQLMKDHTGLDWRNSIRECFGGRKENETRVLVVASSRSGCFPAKGVLAAVGFVNQKAEVGGKAEGVELQWGGHWCYWEDADKFNALAIEFLQRN